MTDAAGANAQEPSMTVQTRPDAARRWLAEARAVLDRIESTQLGPIDDAARRPAGGRPDTAASFPASSDKVMPCPIAIRN